jgi:hypothetical protein
MRAVLFEVYSVFDYLYGSMEMAGQHNCTASSTALKKTDLSSIQS